MFEEENNIHNESNADFGTNRENKSVVSEPYRYKYENGEKREESASYYVRHMILTTIIPHITMKTPHPKLP